MNAHEETEKFLPDHCTYEYYVWYNMKYYDGCSMIILDSGGADYPADQLQTMACKNFQVYART